MHGASGLVDAVFVIKMNALQTWGDAVYLCNQTLFAPLLNVSIVNFILRVGIEPSSKFIIQACPRIRVFSQVKRQSCAAAAV
jgi:hypothetical protein